MVRFLSLCICGLVVSAALLGCEDSGIQAQAPGIEHPFTASAASEGDYGLYHVTQFNNLGQPTDYKLLKTYHLQSGDPVGFHWIVDKSNINAANAQMVLEAYAGNNSVTLGPVTTMVEKYYWCNTAQWASHWHMEPAVATANLIKMQ